MKQPRPNPITDRNRTREVWFVDSTRRLTGETSPRNEEAVVFRDLLENADEVRAAMRYDGLSSRLSAAEDAATIQWMTYVIQLRTDMFHRMVSQATGKENMTFAHAGWPQRMVPHFAVGAWGSEAVYTLRIFGDIRYETTVTITPPEGIKVTANGMSNTLGEALVLTLPAVNAMPPADLLIEAQRLHEIQVTVSVFEGSALEARVDAEEQFQELIGNTVIQNDRFSSAVSVVVLFN